MPPVGFEPTISAGECPPYTARPLGPTFILYYWWIKLGNYIIIIIIVRVIACMQGIYNYTPETKHVSMVYSVAAVLYLQFVLHVMLFCPCNIFCTFTFALSIYVCSAQYGWFWRVNVLYFVGIGSQPQKTWRHRNSLHRKSSHATMMAETGNHYRYGNGNMAEQTTTWPLSNHSDPEASIVMATAIWRNKQQLHFIYSHFLITY